MMRFFEKTRASVSVFLILVLMPMYTCAYLAIDSARFSAAKAKVSGAADLTGNAALADYDRTFKELYGLFVMSKSEEEMTANLVSCFSNMIDSTELSFGDTTLIRQMIGNVWDISFENTVKTGTEDFSIAYEAPLYDTKEMDEAIRSFMKYRAPYSFAHGLAQKVSAFRQADEIKQVTDYSRSYYKSVGDAEAELKGVYTALSKVSGLTEYSEIVKALTNVKKTLSSVKKELKKTAEKASEWSGSLESLEDGEVKELLKSEYAGTAEALSMEAVEDFEKTLSDDIEALKEAIRKAEEARAAAKENEDGVTETGEAGIKPEDYPVELKYSRDPFFVYLTSTYGRNLSSPESSGSEKSALDTIASTDLSVYTGDVESIVIPELVSEEILRTVYESSSETGIDLKGLAKLKDAAMNSYETEYICGMFGCLTSSSTDKNLMGVPFGTRPVLRGETEFIVFGKDNMAANVALCVELIFAIRLIMNSVYVYTNASMRQTALAVATAIAGWTGIGIPVAQNAILLAWATAESILDTASLCKGETVPVYKTSATWTLSIQNLPATLAKGAADYASREIDDVFEKIETVTTGKTEEAKNAALEYIDHAGSSAVENLTGIVVTPVERAVTSLTNGANLYLSRDDVETALLSAVNSVDSSAKGVRQAKELFITHCLPSLTDKVYENLPSLVTTDATLAEQASGAIRSSINDAYQTLYARVSGELDSLANEAESRVTEALDKASEVAKKEAVSVMNDYADSLAEYIGETKENSVSGKAGFGMTYRDYLKLFMLIGLSGDKGKENMLKRCAVIMQINCSAAESGFNITGCYRGIRLFTATGVASHTVSFEEAYHY